MAVDASGTTAAAMADAHSNGGASAAPWQHKAELSTGTDQVAKGSPPHGVSHPQQVRGRWSRACRGGMSSGDGNRRQGPRFRRDGEAPWNLRETKMEGIGVDLERAKWC
jgi:hypothetical protein